METNKERVRAEIAAYSVRHDLSQRSLAHHLGWTPSRLAMKLTGARAWSLADLDELEAAGVLSVEVRPQAVTA